MGDLANESFRRPRALLVHDLVKNLWLYFELEKAPISKVTQRDRASRIGTLRSHGGVGAAGSVSHKRTADCNRVDNVGLGQVLHKYRAAR